MAENEPVAKIMKTSHENSSILTSTDIDKDALSNSADNVNSKKEIYNERSAFYKKPIKKDNLKLESDFDDTPQEIRRQQLLEQQRKSRETTFDSGRGLLLDAIIDPDHEEEIGHEEEMGHEEELEYEEEMEHEEETPEDVLKEMKIKKVKKKRLITYKKMFMLSEWMIDVPQDFANNWIMVPCPNGKRVFIVASRGTTKLYSRQGRCIARFSSVLPGGSYKTNKNNCTVLDGVWLPTINSIYIFDLLIWADQKMVDCEAACRFYCLKSRVEELNALHEKTVGFNDILILLLPTVPCSQDFYQCLESFSGLDYELDGLMFYHKEAYYTYGKTPLVMWLKPYMLPEVLGMNVPEPYSEQPDDYISFEHHVNRILFYEMRLEKKRKRRKYN